MSGPSKPPIVFWFLISLVGDLDNVWGTKIYFKVTLIDILSRMDQIIMCDIKLLLIGMNWQRSSTFHLSTTNVLTSFISIFWFYSPQLYCFGLLSMWWVWFPAAAAGNCFKWNSSHIKCSAPNTRQKPLETNWWT